MSRFGNKPVIIPEGVEVNINGQHISVNGQNGKLERDFVKFVKFNKNEDGITVAAADENDKQVSKFIGLSVRLLENMIIGVTKKFKKRLLLNGVGYRAQMQDKILNLKLGYSHDINFPVPEGINITVEKNTIIDVEGIDKEVVGQTASNIRNYRPVEPYKGKGIKYENEYVIRKEGKSAVGGGS